MPDKRCEAGDVGIDSNVQIRWGMKGIKLCGGVCARASAETICLCRKGVRALQWRIGGREAEFEAIYAVDLEKVLERTEWKQLECPITARRCLTALRKHQTARKQTPATAPHLRGIGANTIDCSFENLPRALAICIGVSWVQQRCDCPPRSRASSVCAAELKLLVMAACQPCIASTAEVSVCLAAYSEGQLAHSLCFHAAIL
jgi:hypothetical protein